MIKALKKCAVLLILIALCAIAASAQSIKGTVTDSTGKTVPYANINLKSSNLIIAYAITDLKGAYTLQVPADAAKNGLRIEVSCIGFKTQSKNLTDLSAPVN